MTKIKIKKVNQISEEKYGQINKLSLYGLVKFIDGFPIGQAFDSSQVIDQFGIDFHTIRKQLEQLAEKKILNLRLTEDNDIILEVDFLSSSEVQNDNLFNYFEIDDTSFQNIINMSTVAGNIDLSKMETHLYSYIQGDIAGMNNYVINSEEEYIQFLSNVRPQDFITSTSGTSLNNNQFTFLYKMFFEYNFSKELVNLAIDYTISTNVYNTFNVKFATSLMYNWKRNKIGDLQSAIKFIKESKDKINEIKDDNLFVEPVWEEVEISSTNADVFSLLDKAYNE